MAAPLRRHASGDDRGDYRSPELLEFVTRAVSREPEAFARIRLTTTAKGLPAISIGPDEGRLLHFLVRACGARRAVEIGTLAGYSACWISSALPGDGVLHTCEYDAKHARVARENLREAGLQAKVSVHEGPALATLPALAAAGPYDFVFIDADKRSYEDYCAWARENTRPGALVVCDNAYLFGHLHESAKQAGQDAEGAAAMRAALELLSDPAYFSSCAMIPTGEGLAVAVRA